MKLTLKATGFDLTPSIKQYVATQLHRLDKLVDNLGTAAEAWVEISKTTKHHRSGPVWRAEVDLRLPRKILRVESVREALASAVVEAREELFRRIVTYRNRHFAGNPKSVSRKRGLKARGKE